MILARDARNQKFIMKDEFSIENLQAFVNDLDEGSLEAYVKSQPIPESNDGPVTVAVGKTFDDVVMNNGKDTLVEFYAEWCGHVSSNNCMYIVENKSISIFLNYSAKSWPRFSMSWVLFLKAKMSQL